MSSVSSSSASDRSNQTDEIRRIREEYENKESEGARKKNKEIRQMNERHDKEIARIKDEYEEQVATLRRKQTESIDEKDRKYNEDVSRIRDLYVDSLKRKTIDDSREKESLRAAFDQDMQKQKEISAQQKEILQKSMEGAVKEKNQIISDTQKRSEKFVKQGIEDFSNKLTKKHNEELQSVTDDRDRVKGDMSRLVSDIKTADKEELSRTKQNHNLEVDRLRNTYAASIRDEREMHEGMLESRDAMLRDELSNLNQKYQRRIEAENEKMTNLRDQFAEEYEGRTGTEIKKIQSELAKAKNQQVMDAITHKKSSEIEKKNLIRAYQDREDSLQKEKSEVFDTVNDLAHRKISDANRNNEKLISETNRKNKIDQQTTNMKYRDAYVQNEEVYKDQVAQSRNKAEERVQKVMRVSTLAQKNQLKLHEDSLDLLKNKHSEDLQNQREAQLESMKSLYERMADRLKSSEQHLTKKHEDAVDFYENKIDSMQSQHKDDMVKVVKTYESRAQQREKAIKQEGEMIATKYEQKLALAEDAHKQELDRLERRHQEQIQAVISRVNAAQKKA